MSNCPLCRQILDSLQSHLVKIQIQGLTSGDTENRQHCGVDGKEQGGDGEHHAQQVEVEAVHDEAGGV